MENLLCRKKVETRRIIYPLFY